MPLLKLRDGFSGTFRRTVVTEPEVPGIVSADGVSATVSAVTRALKWVPGVAIELTDAEAKSIASDIGETPNHSLRVVVAEKVSKPIGDTVGEPPA